MTTQPCQCPFICGEHPRAADANAVHKIRTAEALVRELRAALKGAKKT